MSHPVNHRSRDSNRHRATTTAYSPSFVPQSSPASFCSSTSSVWPPVSPLPSLVTLLFFLCVELSDVRVLDLRVLISCLRVILSHWHKHRHSHHPPPSRTLSPAHRWVRVRVSGIFGASERGRQRGVEEAERVRGVLGEWEVKSENEAPLALFFSFISSYYF